MKDLINYILGTLLLNLWIVDTDSLSRPFLILTLIPWETTIRTP